MVRTVVGLALVLALGAIAAAVVPHMGQPQDLGTVGRAYALRGVEDTGSANLVTGVVMAYRGLDTLGEVVVLFCASTSVVLILSLYPLGLRSSEPSRIVALTARVFPAPLLLFGVYLASHAHLSPGGGFPGGTVIAAAFLLVMLGGESRHSGAGRLPAVEAMGGLAFGLLGFWGAYSAGQFLYSGVIGSGTPGSVLSAGIVPLISLAIGAKVASEFSSVFDAFRRMGGPS